MLSFLLLLVVALAVRYLALRYFSIFKPQGRLQTAAFSLAGAWGGSLLLNWAGLGPQLGQVNVPGAVLGAALTLFLAGLFPFLKILLGRPRTP